MYRKSPEIKDAIMVIGKHKRVKDVSELDQVDKENVIQKPNEILKTINETIGNTGPMVI